MKRKQWQRRRDESTGALRWVRVRSEESVWQKFFRPPVSGDPREVRMSKLSVNSDSSNNLMTLMGAISTPLRRSQRSLQNMDALSCEHSSQSFSIADLSVVSELGSPAFAAVFDEEGGELDRRNIFLSFLL